MAPHLTSLGDRLWHKRAMRRLDAMIQEAPGADMTRLHGLRGRARDLRRAADQVLRIADARLALPLLGSNAVESPLHSDWAHRPDLWREPAARPGHAGIENNTRLAADATLFHNCTSRELTVRQIRNTREEDLAPFGIWLDVFRFDGTFLSLVVDLPGAAIAGLKRRHLIRLAGAIETEQPLEIFARLNVRNGPNTAQVVRELPLNDISFAVDFDLAYSDLNEKRVERAWVDLIFEAPQMNQIAIRDLTLSRRPRAEV